jgi:hypothetical protein
MQQLVWMFELQARDKGLSFDYQPVGALPAIVRADEKRLRQILINVLGNAVKFTVRGGVVFRVECRREMATFEIRDSGPGILADDMQRIFEPFAWQQRDGGGQRGRPDHRPHAHRPDGRRDAGLQPAGEGTLFRIRLFLPQVHSAQAARELPRVDRIGYAGVRRRILVVDNEKVDRELLCTMLEPLGFIVEQAASGFECLAIVPRLLRT